MKDKAKDKILETLLSHIIIPVVNKKTNNDNKELLGKRASSNDFYHVNNKISCNQAIKKLKIEITIEREENNNQTNPKLSIEKTIINLEDIKNNEKLIRILDSISSKEIETEAIHEDSNNTSIATSLKEMGHSCYSGYSFTSNINTQKDLSIKSEPIISGIEYESASNNNLMLGDAVDCNSV